MYARTAPDGVQPAAPHFIGFEPSEIDLGEQLWGTHVPFVFDFRNDSIAPVTIVKTRRSCDCTVFDDKDLKGKTIQPGQSLSVKGKLATGSTPDRLVRQITFETGDGGVYDTRLTVAVRPSYRLSPDRLSFDVLEDDAPTTNHVFFDSDISHVIDDPQPDLPWLSAVLDGESVVVTVDPAKIPGGRAFGAITLHTDDPYVPSTVLPVAVSKFCEVNFHPPRVFLAGPGKRTVLVTGAAGEPLEIASVDSETDAVTADLIEPGVIAICMAENRADRGSWNVRVTSADGLSRDLQVTLVGSTRSRP